MLLCSQNYVKGLVTMSAPFGGTTDQAITVRMGAVEWNINEWVKNPISRIAKDLAAHAQVLPAKEAETVWYLNEWQQHHCGSSSCLPQWHFYHPGSGSTGGSPKA